ncbi:hypothetical protein CEF21_00440 [Bacillus sp. FJAT-42376]|nr:hypothetical protein CEF21_00440 [Bacillus sp. FJAT-42376]
MKDMILCLHDGLHRAGRLTAERFRPFLPFNKAVLKHGMEISTTADWKSTAKFNRAFYKDRTNKKGSALR